MEIDLKDNFWGIFINEKLSRLYGFTYGDRRYRLNRFPKGWKWSIIMFYDCVTEIVKGICCLQYAGQVLIGAETIGELCNRALQVFPRFDEYGIKVN